MKLDKNAFRVQGGSTGSCLTKPLLVDPEKSGLEVIGPAGPLLEKSANEKAHKPCSYILIKKN